VTHSVLTLCSILVRPSRLRRIFERRILRTFAASANRVSAFASAFVCIFARNDGAGFARLGRAAGPIGIGMRIAIVLTVASCSGSSEAPEGTLVAGFSYAPAARRGYCDNKPGAAGATNGLSSRDGFHYNVRAPANLDPTYTHPLLVVYAPAGHSAEQSESLTRLTTDATRRGFIVAYVGSRPLSQQTVIGLARVPKEVASSWCVDPNRVYATGHSDGGTVSTALALLKETKGVVSAIAPSAAGFSPKDLEGFQCPEPIPVMVMHGKRDTHFPGWGKEAARWWARCNACDLAKPPTPQDDGCITFAGCLPGGRTDYCEGAGAHEDWPPLRNRVIQFFEAAGSP
jgi:polyhydroxybutyrate depolymerase